MRTSLDLSLSPTSRIANVLFANVFWYVDLTVRFANVLGQFHNFFNITNGLKNELYTYVKDFYVSYLKEWGIYRRGVLLYLSDGGARRKISRTPAP